MPSHGQLEKIETNFMNSITMPSQEFLWGVSTSAYQAEGGFNGEGQPQTNWARAERAGVVAQLGGAAEFWKRHASDFACSQELGLNAFRLGIEWSRVQPCTRCVEGEAPPFDDDALAGYAAMLASCRAHELEPVVTLHHFVHPAWLGSDPWLSVSTLEAFDEYVRTAVTRVNSMLIAQGSKPVRFYITVNEPNMLVLNTYLRRQFPSAKRSGLGNMIRAYDILLAAHVRAYNIIHDVYAANGWDAPMVTFNNYCSDLYWSDKLLLDLVNVRARGVERAGIHDYVKHKSGEFRQRFRAARLPLHRDLTFFVGKLVKWLSDTLGERRFQPDSFPILLDTIYGASRAKTMDYLGLDYYDPFLAHTFRIPRWSDIEMRTRSFRAWMMNTVTSKWWDWRVLPRGLYFFVRTYAEDFGLPALIAENGMALPVRWDNSVIRRRDGMKRSRFLELHVAEVNRLRRDGVPLFGYLYWSLFDNYEWGSYTPRFGLLSIDFERGTDRRLDDSEGDTPARTYAMLVKEARAVGAADQASPRWQRGAGRRDVDSCDHD